MARQFSKNLTAAIRAPFWKKFGLKQVAANNTNALAIGDDWRRDNGFQARWDNAAGTDAIRGMEVNGSDQLLINEEVFTPMRKTVRLNVATAASLVTQHFFIADRAYRIAGVTEIHKTAESTAATLTGYVEKITGTTAPGSGATIQTGTFNLKGTANTLQTGVLLSTGTGDSDDPVLQLAAGDRLGFVFSAAGTELAGLVVEITLAPAGTGESVIYNMQVNGDLVDQTFFIANRDYTVVRIDQVHSTLGSSTPTIDVKKCTGVQAAASGTTLLSATFDAHLSANTVRNGSLTATAADLRLAPGDRLAIDFGSTLTALAGVIVQVTLAPVERRREVSFVLSKNANQAVDQCFFIADRNYDLVCVSQVHSVAAGGASKIQVTRDKTTDVPGAGTDLIALNSAAGFDLNATAETVQVAQICGGPGGTATAGFVDARFGLMAGDRLAVDYANAAQSSAGVVVTVSLIPR